MESSRIKTRRFGPALTNAEGKCDIVVDQKKEFQKDAALSLEVSLEGETIIPFFPLPLGADVSLEIHAP